jgi:hypothetical protein
MLTRIFREKLLKQQQDKKKPEGTLEALIDKELERQQQHNLVDYDDDSVPEDISDPFDQR